MRSPKQLPLGEWPEADREAFQIVYKAGDVFDETTGSGAHLADGTRGMIETAYRRWLGFLKIHHPGDLSIPPAARITQGRVRAFIDHLSMEVRPSSLAIAIDNLFFAARLIAPGTDWAWLRSIRSRLASRASPENRFNRLVPPLQTLDFGIELMDTAVKMPITGHKKREIQYRDGLLLALLSLWPIRRRSLTALTISRHLEFDDLGVNILLHSSDTKAKRAESFRVPEQLFPYLIRYLQDIRPVMVGRRVHDGFWASYKGGPLTADRLYNIVRARVALRFGKAMGVHDFRRAASTFMAMQAPDRVGLIPGVLQHASPEVAESHYNLARSTEAGRRFATHLAKTRTRLRSVRRQDQD